MDLPRSSEEAVVAFEPSSSSLTFLLEYGLQGIRKGLSTEKLLILALAYEQLAPKEAHLHTAVEGFTQSYTRYVSAQQTFQEISKQLVEAEAEVQTKLDVLEQLLANVVKDIDITSLTLPKWLMNLIELQGHPIVDSPQPPLKSTGPFQASQPQEGDHKALPTLYFICFSRFEVWRLGQPLPLCANRSGQVILRYLVTQPGHRASIDKLIGVLWPDNDREVARRRLQVAVSTLRCSLNNGYVADPGGGYILFKDWVYQLNPAIACRSDVDDFLELYRAGCQTRGHDAVLLYERACQLYTGPFLVEDIYADWSIIRREQLSQLYQKMCSALTEYYLKASSYEDVIKWASAVLRENGCDETAHRQLIRAYAAQGRRSEALRQYHRCEQILHTELVIAPMPETTHLYQALFAHDHAIEEAVGDCVERKLSGN